MSETYLDGLLDELLTAEPQEEWSDVLRRARRARRRWMALAAVAGALVVAPAAWAAVNAFEGTPAPQVIQQHFDVHMVTVDPQNGFITNVPGADASKAHGVLQLDTSNGLFDLWAAPESDGTGKCWFVGWESEMSGDHAVGYGSCTQVNDAAIAPQTYSEASHPSYTVLVGSVSGSETTLDVTLADGSTTTLRVVEHLFLGALPAGSELASITGLDADGDVVASWTPSG